MSHSVRSGVHSRRHIEISDTAQGVGAGELFQTVWIELCVGISVFHNSKVTLGISHKEMIACRVGVHIHAVILQHFLRLLHGACAVEQHAHSHSGEDFLVWRIRLGGGESVEL